MPRCSRRRPRASRRPGPARRACWTARGSPARRAGLHERDCPREAGRPARHGDGERGVHGLVVGSWSSRGREPHPHRHRDRADRHLDRAMSARRCRASPAGIGARSRCCSSSLPSGCWPASDWSWTAAARPGPRRRPTTSPARPHEPGCRRSAPRACWPGTSPDESDPRRCGRAHLPRGVRRHRHGHRGARGSSADRDHPRHVHPGVPDRDRPRTDAGHRICHRRSGHRRRRHSMIARTLRGLGALAVVVLGLLGWPAALLGLGDGVSAWLPDLSDPLALLSRPDTGGLFLVIVLALAWAAWVVWTRRPGRRGRRPGPRRPHPPPRRAVPPERHRRPGDRDRRRVHPVHRDPRHRRAHRGRTRPGRHPGQPDRGRPTRRRASTRRPAP